MRDLTDGEGLPVVYDPIGKATVTTSMQCLKPRGLLVSFGNASGPVDSFNLLDLLKHGSLYVTRPTLWHYVTTREEVNEAAGELLAQYAAGNIRIEIGQRFPPARRRRRPPSPRIQTNHRLHHTPPLIPHRL